MFKENLITANVLYHHLNNKKLIILDCTIPKVTSKKNIIEEKKQIKGAIFFDIKSTFSNTNAPFPNTAPSPEYFQEQARKLGVHKDSYIVCYDDLGIYSSPRVWWMFQLMGFKNVAVLDGGLPKWIDNNYPIEKPQNKVKSKGNFIVKYQKDKIIFKDNVLSIIDNHKISILDARSKGRFYGTSPEPRASIKSGHIPNSISLPYKNVLSNHEMKCKDELSLLFNEFNEKEKLIFTCGSGITASILALAATIAEVDNYAVYDGSWTEWGSTENLPIAL